MNLSTMYAQPDDCRFLTTLDSHSQNSANHYLQCAYSSMSNQNRFADPPATTSPRVADCGRFGTL